MVLEVISEREGPSGVTVKLAGGERLLVREFGGDP